MLQDELNEAVKIATQTFGKNLDTDVGMTFFAAKKHLRKTIPGAVVMIHGKSIIAERSGERATSKS